LIEPLYCQLDEQSCLSAASLSSLSTIALASMRMGVLVKMVLGFLLSGSGTLQDLLLDREMSLDVSQLGKTGVVSDKFLSVAIDSHVVAERWKNFDFHSEKVLNMASALAPAYIRLGGTAADLLTFAPNDEEDEDLALTDTASRELGRPWCATNKNGSAADEDLNQLYKRKKRFVMNGKDFDNLYNFSRTAGWSLLFDLNILKRKGKSWDPSNARQILRYAEMKVFGNISWELGNEPNSLKHHLNVSLPARQMGKDFWALKQLLKEFPSFENATLVGPDINGIRKCSPTRRCKPLGYLKNVLSTSGHVLDAITWHQYYLDGHTATLRQFLDPNVLDQLTYQLGLMNSFTSTHSPQSPLWLGETSSAYGGGAHGLSNSFVSGFNWLDKVASSCRNVV
jgi:heparanase 1